MKKSKMNRIADTILVTGFGAGYWPWGPGTAGALVAVTIWYMYALVFQVVDLGLGLSPLFARNLITSTLVLLFTLISIKPIDRIEKIWGSDPKKVVVDEMVGAWITLLAVPEKALWWHIVGAFLLFRIMDIWKPLGIRWIDNNVKGGIGVMLDDILAGLYGLAVLGLITYVC